MNIETMEGRTLFSVTVSEASPGYYEINGDADADEITVAVDMNNGTFTLDATEYFDVAYITVNGGGGDDTINLCAGGPGAIGTSVNAGDGNDIVSVNFEASVWGGGGNDEIYLGDAFRGEVYGEAGDDTIYIYGACVGAVVDGGNGQDWIDASGCDYGLVIYGGNGDDQIYGSNHGDMIYGGSGADTIVALAGSDDIYTSGDGAIDWIDGGDGFDTLYGDTVEVHVQNVEHSA